MRLDCIEERRGSSGVTRYRVRVRGGGGIVSATFDALDEAIGWRDAVLASLGGRGEMPAVPRRQRARRSLPATPRAVVTVEDSTRRLCRAMKDGTARTRTGTPYKPSVIRTYEEALRLDVVPRIGDIPVAAVRRGDVQLLVDEIAAERSPRHAQKALTAVRVAFRLCERYGEVDMTPCVRISVPRGEDEGERPPRVLTPEEVAKLLEAAAADDKKLERSFAVPFLALLAGTGIRTGEARALVWGPDGLDLDAKLVRVRRSLDRVRGDDGGYEDLPAKSRKSRRDVPLAAEEVARLRRHRLATGRPADGELVFTDRRG